MREIGMMLKEPLTPEQLDEVASYAAEEAYQSPFSLEKQKRMRDEFLQYVSSTFYTCVETAVGPLYLAYLGNQMLQFASLEDEVIFLCKAEQFLWTRPVPDKDRYLPVEMIEQVQTSIEQGVLYEGNMSFSRLTPFQTTVLQQVQQIPFGQTCTYATLAQAIGRPQAQAAVAKVLMMNPFPVLIPCHRIVCADGRLGTYCSGGPATKKRLLGLEGVMRG